MLGLAATHLGPGAGPRPVDLRSGPVRNPDRPPAVDPHPACQDAPPSTSGLAKRVRISGRRGGLSRSLGAQHRPQQPSQAGDHSGAEHCPRPPVHHHVAGVDHHEPAGREHYARQAQAHPEPGPPLLPRHQFHDHAEDRPAPEHDPETDQVHQTGRRAYRDESESAVHSATMAHWGRQEARKTGTGYN